MRLKIFIASFFSSFFSVLIRSCYFLIVPRILMICLLFLEPFHVVLLLGPLLGNLHIREQHPTRDLENTFIMILHCFKSMNAAILASP